jgi:type II secretory pathway pseudopilin PulG
MGRRRRPRNDDDGFILLESVVAISLITVILAALGTFTLNSVALTSQLRARQAAAQVATSAVASLGAIPATDLVTGRDTTSVTAQFGAAPSTVSPSLTTMSQLSDTAATAGAGATATISTSPVPQVLNNISFSVNTYLGRCFMQATSTDCRATGAGVQHVRAVVAVTWQGRGCGSTSCVYVTSTLINQDDDPIFNLNTANPPAVPVVEPPGNQTSTLGATVSLQLAAKTNTGVPPFTWQVTSGTLPAGLVLSASGLISGVPTVIVTNTALSVTVTDAFGRTGVGSFAWTIVAAPTVTTPATQTSTVGRPASLAVVSTCPNTPCVFTLTNPPPGLTINATTGLISGTPTTAGTYATVTVTVTDADNAAATSSAFTWKVLPAPTVGAPGSVNATVTGAESVAIAYTCPTATCTIALTGLMPGLGLSATTPNLTNNATTSLTVSSSAGTVYLAGILQTTAVTSGTSTGYAPTLTITDLNLTSTASSPGAWTAFTKPTVAGLTTRSMTVKETPNQAVAYTCPNAPCTVVLTNTIPGLGLSATAGVTTANATTSLVLPSATGTFYLNGLVDVSAVPSGTSKVYTPTVTLTDSDTISTVGTGTWTVFKAPAITDPGSQAMEPNQNLSLQMAAACPNGGCTWQAAAQVGADPTWITIPITAGGLITYTSAPAGTYTLRVIATDGDAITDTVFIPLTVATFSLPIATQTATKPTTGTKIVTLNVAALMSPLAAGYSYVLTGQPSWLAVNATTGLLTATLTTTSATDSAITVTVTSVASSTSTVSTTFGWTIS